MKHSTTHTGRCVRTGSGTSFSLVEKHADVVSAGDGHPRLVLSRLSQGESPIYCATPSIKFVLEGEERFVIGKVEHIVLPGQFLVVEAGTELHARLPRRATTIGMCMYLPGDPDMPSVTFSERPREMFGSEGRAVVLSSSGTVLGEHLQESALLLSREAGNAERAVPSLIMTRAAALLKPTLLDVHSQLGGLNARKGRTKRDLLRQLDLVRAWLHDNDHRTVPLTELARVGGISQFHLLRSFSAAYGAPPATFHRKLRLSKAYEQLRRGCLDPADAAEKFGFSDNRAFDRAFKNQFGISPRACA